MKTEKKNLRILAAVLSVLLVLTAAALAWTLRRGEAPGAVAPGNRIGYTGALRAKPAPHSAKTTSDGKTAEKAELSLSTRQSSDNTLFAAENMFPGDADSGLYRVAVSYTGDVTLRFHADITSGAETLGRVLMVRVTLPQSGKTLYEGPMATMPKSLDLPLSADARTTQEAEYLITAWLDTSVGNEYQDKTLTADFRWWVEETDNLMPPPNTGDPMVALIWVVLGIFALGGITVLVSRRRGGRSHE